MCLSDETLKAVGPYYIASYYKMATVENPYEMLGEKNVSSARSETEVSFRIDDLVGEAMELVPVSRFECVSGLSV